MWGFEWRGLLGLIEVWKWWEGSGGMSARGCVCDLGGLVLYGYS